MRPILLLSLLALAAAGVSQPIPSELDQVRKLEKDLKFDDLFPRRPFTGKTANVQGWSFDDRYVTYLWNPYDIRGNDLWLLDTKTGKTQRLTAIEMMAKFDLDAKKAIEFYKKEDERLKLWDGLSDAEWRKARQKLREEREKPEKAKKPDPSYPGVSFVKWANKSNEFLMGFKGDLWRWKIGEAAPKRLTQTDDSESNVEYLPDDSGYVFQRGTGIYKSTFGSEFVRQINPKLPDGVSLSGYEISPDGKQMLVYGNKDTGTDRQVDWITYRERFAKAQKTSRGVSEDDFTSETTLYLFDITDASLDNIDAERKPYEIYKWPGGQEWFDLSVSEKPWSADSSTFVFASWKRDQKDFRIMEADLKRKVVRTVYKGTSDGEQGSPGLAKPFYTADGKNILAMLDKSGWRQLHVIERVRGEERQLTKGEFEVYPEKLSADNRAVLVRSSKQNLARTNVYRVDLATGEMTNLTSREGTYSDVKFAHKADDFTTVFSSWTQLRELYHVRGASESVLTDSHRAPAFWSVIKQKPELFTYKNRHGDEVHGFAFLPPNLDKAKKHPLFIYVYGGPLGTDKKVVDGVFASTEYLFNMYLAQTLGYITIAIDPRGSSGYNARFGKSNFDNPGVGQTEDLVDAVKYCSENYGVDPKRVGLTGWSFGGWQTQHAMYTAPETFTLGIAGAGPTEWQNYNNWYTGGVIGNTPKDKGDYLDKFSLTLKADNLRSPLLLLHGIEDTNVLFQDTIHVYRKLLQAGKGDLVSLAFDPTGGHGLGGDIDTRDRLLIYLSFILRFWGVPM